MYSLPVPTYLPAAAVVPGNAHTHTRSRFDELGMGTTVSYCFAAACCVVLRACSAACAATTATTTVRILVVNSLLLVGGTGSMIHSSPVIICLILVPCFGTKQNRHLPLRRKESGFLARICLQAPSRRKHKGPFVSPLFVAVAGGGENNISIIENMIMSCAQGWIA